MRWFRRESADTYARSTDSRGSRRLDVPVYLDAGVALSLSASLGRGLVMESSVERAVADKTDTSLGASGGVPRLASIKSQFEGSQSVAVTESEVRKHTQESIFNNVRGLLEDAQLITTPQGWTEAEWRIGDFVDLRTERIVVPLVSVLARLRVIAEAFASFTDGLSPDALEKRIPQFLDRMRAAAVENSEQSSVQDHPAFDVVVSLLHETGEIAGALAGVIKQLEEEAEASGLVDVVMLERWREAAEVVVVASLDRDYVDDKLLRRLGQSNFGVLGKVIRTPEENTAFNAFRNSMFGATNQLPRQLSGFTERLKKLPNILGDAVFFAGEDGNMVVVDIVGSASAIAEMSPLLGPTVELFPIAIYV